MADSLVYPILDCTAIGDRLLIKDESVTNRNWEGDREGPFVTYRSLAGAQRACAAMPD